MKNTKQKTAINVADMETVKSFITRLPAEWGKMSLYERLNFLRDGDFDSQKNDGGVQRQLPATWKSGVNALAEMGQP